MLLFFIQVFGQECTQSVTLMAKRMNGLDWAANEASWVRYVHWQYLNRGMVSPFHGWLLLS
jgi:hypothetical protein